MTPIVLYIGFAQPDEWRHWAATYALHAAKFEAASGCGCLVVPFNLATASLVSRIQPQAVVLSGFARSFQDYDIESLHPIAEWIEHGTVEVPTLAICGSHQLLGFLYSGELKSATRLYDQPIRKLNPGEPITNPDYHPDYFMEKGFYTLQLTEAGACDPLFSGIDPEPVVCESHYCEIKQLPDEFSLLASTPECRIQSIKHSKRNLYGVQFHPEDYTERFPAGKRILENFFSLSK